MTPEIILLWAMTLFGQVPPALVGTNNDVGWNPVTTNVAGQPDVIALYEIAASDPSIDLNTVVIFPTPGAFLAIGTELPSDLPDIGCSRLLGTVKNGVYSIQVRAKNKAGNLSAWSAKFLVEWNGIPPAAPTGLRVTVSTP